MWKVNDEGVMEYSVDGLTVVDYGPTPTIEQVFTKPETEEEKQIRYWRALQDAARG